MILGAVLAGGASSRFGSDKAMAMAGGLTLLDHARSALAPFVDAVMVVGRGEIDDAPAAGLGPLGGIAGALGYAARARFTSVMTIGCDMPAVPAALLAALRAAPPCYCPDAPVLGHWPVDLAGQLIVRLSQVARPSVSEPAGHDGRMRDTRSAALSVRRWATDVGAAAISSPTPLRNINTLADLSPP